MKRIFLLDLTAVKNIPDHLIGGPNFYVVRPSRYQFEFDLVSELPSFIKTKAMNIKCNRFRNSSIPFGFNRSHLPDGAKIRVFKKSEYQLISPSHARV